MSRVLIFCITFAIFQPNAFIIIIVFIIVVFINIRVRSGMPAKSLIYISNMLLGESVKKDRENDFSLC